MTITDAHHRVVYFGMRSTSDDTGQMGAALAVDSTGLPVEFRCSVPVRPSLMQRAVYGRRLDDHIAIDLCGRPLLQALESEPAVCLVEYAALLDLQQDLPLPVFHAWRADASHGAVQLHQDAGNGSGAGGTDDVIRIDSPPGSAPVFLRRSPHWRQPVEAYISLLERISAKSDLLEPFDRLTAACQLQCQVDPRFQ